jgi:hypothetical protein
MKIKAKAFPTFMHTSIYIHTALIYNKRSAEAAKDKEKV